jgi:CheY-like chemotaxis protein/two-component sensor histidine kinase
MVSMGTLAAGVAHEINNPLAYVTANLSVVEDALNEQARRLPDLKLGDAFEALRDARRGTDRVRVIVRDLKTFSRSDEQSTESVDLERVIESAINMAHNEIRHRAQLVKEFGRVPRVRANEARLGQVFLNLVINAAQAMPEGRVGNNEIRVVTRTDERGRAVAEVRDTGSGIPAAMLERIFDPFFTTKPVGVGTGLGLSICQSIVGDLGGEIDVQSKEGQGTTFRVMLSADQKAQAPPRAAAPSAESAARPARLAVLVVDDEPSLARALRRWLGGANDVTIADSGREALRILVEEQQRFDVILCDLMMPDLTGMDVYEELRRARPGLEHRIVFMTGGAFTARARAFLDSVANPRLEKPLDLQSVRTILRDVTARG